ncbi:hypothetical protein N9448_01585 [Litorivicinus sp.]|nr:hypothetical protein [Litorivicinus sp.]
MGQYEFMAIKSRSPFTRKAEKLLEQKNYKKLKNFLKQFPPELDQAASEYNLRMLADMLDWKSLSAAFDVYLAQYDRVNLENLETACRLKVDRGEYDKAIAIADRILTDDPKNYVAVNAVYSSHAHRANWQGAYHAGKAMYDTWVDDSESKARIVEAQSKVVIACAMTARYAEGSSRWDQIKPDLKDYQYLMSSEHFAGALRCYVSIGRIDDAVDLLQGLDPIIRSHPNVQSTIPGIWFAKRDKEQTIQAYQDALDSGVDIVEVVWNRGLARLGFGDQREGFEDYEIRWKWKDFPSAKRIFSTPLWMGEDLTDKRILVWGEQGVGDQLLFLTQLPCVLNKNPKEVIVEVSQKLVPLVTRWYPEVTVRYDRADDENKDTIGMPLYDELDYNIPAGTLPLRMVEQHGKINPCTRQLRVPESAKARLYPEQIADKEILLGVSWRSHLINDARVGNYLSVDGIEKILEILPDNVGVIILQYSLADGEAERLAQFPNIFIPEQDFFENVDMNALYAGTCDFILSSGTATVQLAGIYGVPLLTWLPYGDWVTLGETKRYPWFSNMLMILGESNWDNTTMLYELIDKLKIFLRIK